jgi:hypothetical protein
MAEHTEGARTGAVALLYAFGENAVQKVQILFHEWIASLVIFATKIHKKFRIPLFLTIFVAKKKICT